MSKNNMLIFVIILILTTSISASLVIYDTNSIFHSIFSFGLTIFAIILLLRLFIRDNLPNFKKLIIFTILICCFLFITFCLGLPTADFNSESGKEFWQYNSIFDYLTPISGALIGLISFNATIYIWLKTRMKI